MAKKRKLIKTLLAVLVFIALLLTTAWYLVTYRFKEALQYIVKTESDGTYVLYTKAVVFSFFEKSVNVREAHLVPTDSLAEETRYDVKIPAVFFSIKSWSEILFAAKVTVDSFSIDFPEISIHDRSKDKPKKKRITVHASDVFDKLQDIKSHLSVRSFTLNNAAFSYGSARLPGKFHSNRINFSVKNFDDTDSNKHFLTSESVLLDIADQHWKLPNDRHEIQFRQLWLSGEERVFRIDSCTFSGLDKYNRPFSVSVDRILFSTDNLAALYQKDELIIDSLLLIHPRITIPTSEKKKKDIKDNEHVISGTIKEMLPGIQVKYIHIDSGMVFLADNKEIRPLSKDKTDIKIYNLQIAQDDRPLRTDSIILSQQKIAFTTRDNLFKLNIDRFLLKDNSLYLSDVLFTPTPQNKEPKIFTFKAPAMRLKNIDLEDLIEKKISAEAAELINPEIDFVNNQTKRVVTTAAEKATKLQKFYTTLSALNELLDVDSFLIRNGNVSYRAFGDATTYLKLNDIDLDIRLNEFAASDDLGDIEESISSFRIQDITLYTPTLLVNAERLHMRGKRRKTEVASFSVHATKNKKLDIAGSGMTLSDFRWNGLLKKQVKLKSIGVKNVSVDLSADSTHSDTRAQASSALPLLDIGRLDLDSVTFKSKQAAAISFSALQCRLDNIRTDNGKFFWAKATAAIDSFQFENETTAMFSTKVQLNTAGLTRIQDFRLLQTRSGSSLNISIPAVSTRFPLGSTDFNQLHIISLGVDRPVLSYRQAQRTEGDSTSFALPNLRLDALSVKDASLEFIRSAKKLFVKTGVNLRAKHITTSTALLSLQSFDCQLDSLQTGGESWGLTLPFFASEVKDVRWQVQDEKMLKGHISSRWTDGHFVKQGDSSLLDVSDIDGEVAGADFRLSGAAVNVNSLLDKIAIRTGALRYNGKKSGVQSEFVRWQPEDRTLTTGPYSIKPLLGEKEYFEKLGWQSEYITVSGKIISITGLQYGVQEAKAITASGVLLKDILLTSFRDKTLPLPDHIFKPMFGQMLAAIPALIAIDTVAVENGSVLVDVISGFTKKRASIPIHNINVVVTGLRNFGYNDSLRISGTLQLYNTVAHQIMYKEAHNDSLHNFNLLLNTSPIVLSELSNITDPFANVVVKGGLADTLYAQWNGNKYAAVGKMHFYYKDLKVQLVKSTDSTRSTFMQRILSLFANDVLIRKKNQQASYIFYMRDAQKSVFNYWVKSLLSGALSSSVILQEKKLRKKYNKHKNVIRLPEIAF